MSKETPELLMLSPSKNGLVYLRANDCALIADKAVRKQFKPGQIIIQRQRPTNGIFLLLKGSAIVEIASHLSLEIGPGEVCGEISFLDELPATADVRAKDAVEAYYLDRATLASLFEFFPHLGSRFFHSLALILSRRLRELVDPKIARMRRE